MLAVAWGEDTSESRGHVYEYGNIRADAENGTRGKVLLAHRVSLTLSTGECPPNRDACHSCDFTLCCNPAHLFWGTHRYNILDYIKKYGRIGVSKGSAPAPPRPQLPFGEAFADDVGDRVRRDTPVTTEDDEVRF